MRTRIVGTMAILGLTMVHGACDYLRLLRPTVIEQLDGEVVDLVNYLPEVDDPNEAIVARLFAHGGLSHAERGDDGVWRDRIYVPEDEFIWKPAVIVMERPGELELEFHNDDRHAHAAYLPHSADWQNLPLPEHSGGSARMKLDHPGLYWFGCPVGNHAGRGMLGVIIVEGEVPADARLDRPPQPRPED